MNNELITIEVVITYRPLSIVTQHNLLFIMFILKYFVVESEVTYCSVNKVLQNEQQVMLYVTIDRGR